MHKINIFIITSLLFITLFSCGGREGRDEEDNSGNDSLTFLTDSVSEEDTVPAEKEKPLLSLPETEDQLSYMRRSGHWDKYKEGILPTMAEDVPSYCEKILQAEGKRFIIVDKGKMKVFLYDPYGNVEKSYGIACAKNFGTKHKKGDSRTTEGIFKVKGVFDSTEWLFTDDDGYTSPTKGQFGPRFIRLTIPYIGIHGTGNPGSIGKRCSHGCIRVTNANIMELVKYVEEGMPVIISPGPRDMAVNQQEGYYIPSVSTEPGTPRCVPGRYVPPTEEPKVEKPDTTAIEVAEPVTEPAVEMPAEEHSESTSGELNESPNSESNSVD